MVTRDAVELMKLKLLERDLDPPPDEMDCLDGRDNSRISFFPKRPLNRRDTERPMLKCESGF